MKTEPSWTPNLTPTQRAIFENEKPLILTSGRGRFARPLPREHIARACGVKRAPIYPPRRLARVAPFPWRGFVAVLVVVAIASALYLSAQ